MARFAFVLKQCRLEDEGLKPRRGQSNRESQPINREITSQRLTGILVKTA